MILFGSVALWFVLAGASGAASPAPLDVTEATLSDPAALAALERPGEVFFQEGFESPEALDRWYNHSAGKDDRTQIVFDAALAHSGKGVLQLTAPNRNGKASGAGATYWFHPGYDVVYFRRMIRFAEDYDQGNLNHVGGSLYAVASADRWAEMGKAGIRPKGDDRFGAGFEPWRDWGRNPAPGAMMLYTYWMDMRRDRDGNYWGNNLIPPRERQIVLKRGRWYSLEQMIRANTPGAFDGEMAAWIDGKLYLHLKGLRWRTTPEVRLKRITLGLYVHQSRQTNRVWYDDVVLSTGYIGPPSE